jgi:MoxR-like ATPase
MTSTGAHVHDTPSLIKMLTENRRHDAFLDLRDADVRKALLARLEYYCPISPWSTTPRRREETCMPRLLDRPLIYDLTRTWLDVVANGGSLFQPWAEVWTPAVCDSLFKQIVTTPDNGPGGFQAKLLDQARAEGPTGQRLAAEALYVWQIKDNASGAATKRLQIATLLQGLTPPVSFSRQVENGFRYGMAAYGPGRLRSLPDYLFVLRLASSWAGLDAPHRDALQADPWEFRAFLRGLRVPKAIFARDATQHLVHPETFEPIASLNAKRRILKALAGIKPGTSTDLDRELGTLRRDMEGDGRAEPGFNFYGPDVRPLWDKPTGDPVAGLDEELSADDDAVEEADPADPPIVRTRGRLRLVDLETAVEARELVIDRAVLAGLVAALNSGKHVVLTGAPGTAKTTLAEAVATVARRAALCTGHTLATATADWSTYETVGGYRPRANGTLVFEPGVMLEAISEGRWLVLDEMNRANTDRALGPLFTVLSGQAVVLPAERDGRPVRIRPSTVPLDERYADYVVSPDWRIVATTNVLDRALLFDLSFALMRRFAFVEVSAPDADGYRELVHRALAEVGADIPTVARVEDLVGRLLALTDQRPLGPALFMDAARYMAAYLHDDPGVPDADLILGAFFAYLLPQFEGVDEEQAGALRRVVVAAAGPTSRTRVTETLRQTLGVLLPSSTGGDPIDELDNESDDGESEEP